MAAIIIVLTGCKNAKEGSSNTNENFFCRIHNKEMNLQRVKVFYDLISYPHTYAGNVIVDPPPEYYDTKAKYFPNCKEPENGGCLRYKSYEYIYACRKCNLARDKWLKTYFSNGELILAGILSFLSD
jgi:hypothetical protein